MIRLVACPRQEGFVGLAAFRQFPAAVIHHEHALELDVRTDLLEDIKQHVIHNQKTILGMIDDIGEFFRVQPKVQGMQNGSDRRHTEISFQMLMLVPHQGCHPISYGNTRTLQSRRQLPGAPVQIAVGVTMAGSIAPRRTGMSLGPCWTSWAATPARPKGGWQ